MPRYEVTASRPRIVSVSIDAENESEAAEVVRQALSYAMGMEQGFLKLTTEEVDADVRVR